MPSPPNDVRALSGDPRSLDLVIARGKATGVGVDDVSRRTALRQRLADLAYLSLVTTGWFVGNVLGVLGCAVVFFIVLSAGQWDAFFLQVDNLTSRYVEADIGRRGLFEHYLVQTFMLLFIGITLLRAPGFIRRVRRELAEAPRP